ncbi:acyl-CoA dehydrogenase family protein [Streptomyces canus]|uniref:acyl-CoA dehydrogenase family protein n=1 Tax=Streptomyces canus TaxID=58343 RepID=UPI003682B8F8
MARSLQPLVEAELEQSQKDTIITPKVVRAWKDAGLYKAQLPEHLGGDGADNVTYIQIVEEVARQDASAGWVFAVNTSGTRIAGALMERDAFLELLGPNSDGTAGGFANGKPPGTARKVEGGYIVKTEPMPFGSGTEHLTRAATLLFLVDQNEEKVIGEDGNPVVLTGWADVKHVEWLKNWNASGLASTGSGHYLIKEHFLEDKWIATADPSKISPEPIFQQGFWVPTFLTHVGVALGVAKRAIEEVAKVTKGRRRGAVPNLDEYPLFQYEFVRIESEYQAARAFSVQSCQAAWDAAVGGTFTDFHVARLDQANAHLHRVLNDIVSTVRLWSGSAVIPKDAVLARLVADAQVALNHLVADPQQFAKLSPELLARWRDDSLAKSF